MLCGFNGTVNPFLFLAKSLSIVLRLLFEILLSGISFMDLRLEFRSRALMIFSALLSVSLFRPWSSSFWRLVVFAIISASAYPLSSPNSLLCNANLYKFGHFFTSLNNSVHPSVPVPNLFHGHDISYKALQFVMAAKIFAKFLEEISA